MRSKFVRSIGLAAGAAAAGALFATNAFAHAAPFAITAGAGDTAAINGTVVAVTGTATGTINFKDTRTRFSFNCTVSVVSGTVTAGPNRINPLAGIDGGTAKFTNANNAPCSGPAGLEFVVTGSGTWNIYGTDSTSGTTSGTIINIRAHVSSPGASCEFDVGSNTSSSGFSSSGTSTVASGSQGGSYINSTQMLTTNAARSALGIWNLNPSALNHNCISGSVFSQGDGLSFSGTYRLVAGKSAYNPVAIN